MARLYRYLWWSFGRMCSIGVSAIVGSDRVRQRVEDRSLTLVEESSG